MVRNELDDDLVVDIEVESNFFCEPLPLPASKSFGRITVLDINGFTDEEIAYFIDRESVLIYLFRCRQVLSPIGKMNVGDSAFVVLEWGLTNIFGFCISWREPLKLAINRKALHEPSSFKPAEPGKKPTGILKIRPRLCRLGAGLICC